MQKRKLILITGATSGVGFALTKRLLKEGHDVFATGRSTQALAELKEAGATVMAVDLSSESSLAMLCAEVATPDIVIFSAGVGTFSLAHEQSDDSLQAMMDINVIAPMQLTKRLLPAMMVRKAGHLIYLGSQAGKVATPKTSVYAATKHAVVGYTNALRMEVAPFGIDVSTINPGPIDTPFLDLADDTGKYRAALNKHLLSVDTVVDAIVSVTKKPVREVNLPWYMGITSKLYALAPSLVERLGRRFFMKK